MSDIKQLFAGYERFRRRYFDGHSNLYDRLKLAQQPKVIVIACSDSRVDPAILLDAEPGELFVVRNVANLVPPHAGDHGTHGVSAALEFAVCTLEVSDIIVLGHSQCGGIKALLSNATGEYVSRWMDIAREAATIVCHRHDVQSDEAARACEQHSILLSLQNLLTFPWIHERVKCGTLKTHGWYFDLASGTIAVFDTEVGEFIVVDHAIRE